MENNTNEKKVNRKSKNKRRISSIWIFGLVIILIIVAIIIGIVVKDGGIRVIKTATNDIDMKNNENVEIVEGKKVNNSEGMKEVQHVANLSCEILNLTADEKKSNLTMVVKNETNEDFAGSKATIVFFEKEGRVFGELNTYIGKIAVGESITLELTTTLDVTNAYSYRVEVEKENVKETENKTEDNNQKSNV